MSEEIIISRDTDQKVQSILYHMGIRRKFSFRLATFKAVLPKGWRTIVVPDTRPGHIKVLNDNDKVVFRIVMSKGFGRKVMLGPGN